MDSPVTSYIKGGKRRYPSKGMPLLHAHLSRTLGADTITVDLSDGRSVLMTEDVHTAMHLVQESYPVGNRITIADELVDEL